MANEWEDPPNAHLLHNLQHVDGLGWGPIDPEDLQPQKWEPLLQNELGRGQYTRFVTGMLNRIRFEEGSIEEVKLFADLLSNENPAFLRVATPWIPELNEPTVRQDRNFQISLLIYSLKKLAASRLELEVQQLKAAQKPNTYENGLSNPEKNLLHYNMFGPDGGAQPTERMKSLFDSTINLAFPQAALDHAVAEAKKRGAADIDRDHQGLPTNLRLPVIPRKQKAVKEKEKTPVLTPQTSVEPSRASSPSAAKIFPKIELPPPELMTQTPMDNIVPPKSSEGKIGSSNTKQSEVEQQESGQSEPGEPKEKDLIEPLFYVPKEIENERPALQPHDDVAAFKLDVLDAGAFTQRRKRSPDKPQVPQDELTEYLPPPVEQAKFRFEKYHVQYITPKGGEVAPPIRPISKEVHDKMQAGEERRARQKQLWSQGFENIDGPPEQPTVNELIETIPQYGVKANSFPSAPPDVEVAPAEMPPEISSPDLEEKPMTYPPYPPL